MDHCFGRQIESWGDYRLAKFATPKGITSFGHRLNTGCLKNPATYTPALLQLRVGGIDNYVNIHIDNIVANDVKRHFSSLAQAVSSAISNL